MAEADKREGTDWGRVAKWASRVGAVAAAVGVIARLKRHRQAQ